MTVETTIRSLADKAEIGALRARFGVSLDTRDWTALEDIFTDSVDTDLSQFGVPAAKMARTDFIALFKHTFRDPAIRTQQLYSNFLIEVSGNTATCRSYLHGHHYSPGAADGEVFELRAEYVDGLIKSEHGWRIAKVTLNVISIVGNMALAS